MVFSAEYYADLCCPCEVIIMVEAVKKLELSKADIDRVVLALEMKIKSLERSKSSREAVFTDVTNQEIAFYQAILAAVRR